MKKRLPILSPKIPLMCSILFLVCSLYFFWSSNYFGMPTGILAVRKAAAEHALPNLSWELYRPSLDFAPGNSGGWYFSRQGDAFYIAQPIHNDSFLWDVTLGPDPMLPLSPYRIGFNPIWEEGKTIYESITLVVTPDPAVARIALTQAIRPSDWAGTEGELMAGYSSTTDCVESAPGSGFWVGKQRVTTPPTQANSQSSIFTVHAYAADGTLLYTAPNPS